MTNKQYGFTTSTIGLEQFLNEINAHVTSRTEAQKYPPYNLIEIGTSGYRVELAVAGFSKDEIEVDTASGYLTIRGNTKASIATANATDSVDEHEEDPNIQTKHYAHRGISKKDFKLQWKLGQYLEVKSVILQDGLLAIDLVQELPDSLKPKTFEIK